jgi:serine/threonine protein kinase
MGTELERGSLLDGYQIEEVLEEGQSGAIYRAWDTRRRDAVTVTLLPQSAQSDAMTLVRLREALDLTQNRLSSRFVKILDVGIRENRPYIVTEYLGARSLAQLLAERGRLPKVEAVHYALQVAQALSFAHAQGLVHRDIKPQNILIEPHGTVKIADFGIASVLKNEDEPINISPQVSYPSREQLWPVDERTDVYSLGAVLFESLTGRPLFASGGRSQLLGEAPNLASLRAEVGSRLAAVVERSIERDPSRRFSSMGELARALEASIQGKRSSVLSRGLPYLTGLGVAALLGREAFTTGSGALVSVALAATAVVLLYELVLLSRHTSPSRQGWSPVDSAHNRTSSSSQRE